MNYYHGSPFKFDKFDFSKSKSPQKTMHITPHLEYAKQFAINENGKGYVYTIIIKSEDPNIEYNQYMSNVSFRSDFDLEIINIEEV